MKNSTLFVRLLEGITMVRKMWRVAVCAILIFTLLLTTSCGVKNTPAVGNGGDTSTSGGDNDKNDDNNEEKPYSNYSKILQNVLTDDYYLGLINRRNQDSSFLSTGFFDAHPYGFLEDEGYNIDLIKNGVIKCKTMAYILDEEPNNLYIATNVETNTATPYYTEYLIRYTLTEQEKADYHLLHKDKYLFAVFMNDEISRQKTPTVISKLKCTVEAHEKLYENLKELSFVEELLNDNALTGILLTSYSVENGTFDVLLFSDSYYSMKSTRKVAVAPLTNWMDIVKENVDGAFYEPYQWMKFYYDESSIKPGKEAVVYCSDHYALVKASTIFTEN